MQSTPTMSDLTLTFEVQSLFSGMQRQKGRKERKKNSCLKSLGLFNKNSCKVPPVSTGTLSAFLLAAAHSVLMTAKEEGDSRRSSWAIRHPTKQIATRGPIQGQRGLHIPPRLETRRLKRHPEVSEVLAGAEIRSCNPTQLQE